MLYILTVYKQSVELVSVLPKELYEKHLRQSWYLNVAENHIKSHEQWNSSVFGNKIFLCEGRPVTSEALDAYPGDMFFLLLGKKRELFQYIKALRTALL